MAEDLRPGRIWRLVKAALVVAITAPQIFYLMQDVTVFRPQPLSAAQHAALLRAGMQEFAVTPVDGVRQHGWISYSEVGHRAPVLLYFGARAEETSWLLSQRHHFPDYTVIAMNYRGYGLSGGRPTEDAVVHDALATVDELSSNPRLDASRLLVLGHGLGGAVATWVAMKRPVHCTALIAPYDSYVKLVQERRLLPVEWLMFQRFEAEIWAPRVQSPGLFLAGDRDMVIPLAHSRALFEKWNGHKKMVTLRGADHHLLRDKRLWQELNQYAQRCLTL